MCLIDKKQFRCAEKDIPIFKVVIKCPDGKIISPFLKTNLWRVNNITENYTNKCNTPQVDLFICKAFYIKVFYEFDEGFFHAFTNERVANHCAIDLKNDRFYKENPDYEIIVITGYIPEGTRYALDILEKEICARKMILDI